jgi:hypothetical protein
MGSITPGLLYKVSIAPSITQVQTTTSITFNFTIENELLGGAKIQINLPIYSGALPIGTNLTVVSADNSSPATIATV